MKKISLILSAAVALLAISCGKEIAPELNPVKDNSVKEGKTIIKVSSSDTKTYFGEPDSTGARKVYWQNGDKITVNGVASEPLAGITSTTTSAQFVFYALLDYPYNLVYPSSAYVDENKIAIPDSQVFTTGSFDPSAAISLAYASKAGDQLKLKNPCAIVRIPIKKGTESVTLRSIEFTGKNNEQVSGEFTVNYQNATLAPASDLPAYKKVTMDMSSVTLSEEATSAYIVVPAVTYSSGFVVRICDANGHYMDQSKASSVTLEAGKVYAMPEITFSPTGTLVVVSNADDYLAFASAFKSGTYGSEDKTLLVEVNGELDFNGKTFATVDNDKNIFGGVWNGNGYSMKNITATNTAMFFTPKGQINNVRIDSSCVFKKDATSGGNWGIVVRVLNAGGIVKGCVVDCDWNFDYGAGGNTFGYGSVVGRNDGQIEDCTMNGDVIYTRAVNTKLTNYLNIGGLVGLQNSTGTMKNCQVNGDVIFNEPADEYKPVCATDGKYFHIGGVLGRNLGKAEYLKMTGSLVYKDYVLDAFVGGVVGNSEGTLVDHLTMEGNVSALQPNATKEGKYARLFVGGVLGRAWAGTVSNCTNLAGTKLSGSSQTNNMDLGGIVGTAGGTSVFENCVNNMTVEMNDKAPFYAYVGGVFGAINAGVTVGTAINNGPVNVGVICNTANSQTHVGGVVGYSATVLDGGTITSNKSSIHNNAQVYTNALRACTGFAGANFGGVVGRMDSNAKNLTNSGKVYLNFGDQNEDKTSILKYVSGGGVIGRVPKAVTIDGCVNTALVQFRCFTSLTTADNAKQQVNYIGGIIGSVMSGSNKGGLGATIKNCISYGNINSSNNNTIYPGYNATNGITQGKEEGGVIGVIIGEDGARAVVENCQSASATAHSAQYGYFGGVVGLAIYTDIKGCSNTTNINGAAKNGCTIGGILGITNAKVNITDCTVNFTLKEFTVAGGIVAACNTGSPNQATIEGNRATIVATTTYASKVFGAIARNPVAVTVVQNNGFKGSLNGTALTLGQVAATTTYTCDSSKPNYLITD